MSLFCARSVQLRHAFFREQKRHRRRPSQGHVHTCFRCLSQDNGSVQDVSADTAAALGIAVDNIGQRLFTELLNGSYWQLVRKTFPKIPWGPQGLTQVMQRGLIAGASLSAIYTLIVPQLALSPSASDLRPLSPLWHVCQEGITCTAVLFVLWSSLAKHKPWEQGLLTAKWDSNLILQTVLICCLSFPICDLLVYEPWSRLVTWVTGHPAPDSSPLVLSVQQASGRGDWQTVGAHCFASGVIGPLWEEVLWRGFFLASLTKVLPLPACIIISSSAFAGLHLSPYTFAPLLLLSMTCDLLYLRTANLAPSLLLHALWNTSQLLAIAFLDKQVFV
eukprot:jgi/Chrzof1/7611/Cz02g30060.t1